MLDGLGLGVETDAFFAGKFNPATIPGLLLWLRADQGVTLNGATVSAWNDQSNRGDSALNFTQATGVNQPTFNATNASYNGQPTITFPDNTFLDSGLFAVSWSQPFTVYFVGHTGGGSNCRICQGNLGNGLQLAWYDDGFNLNVSGDGATTVLADTGTTLNTPSICWAVINGASSSQAISRKTADVTGDVGNGGALASLRIGDYTSGGAFSLRGPMAEFLAHSGSSPNLDYLSYLSARFNIAVT